MYQFKEGCNETQFFWWNKKLIETMNWAILPKSSKAVFPVIACHANEKGEAFPSERTIAILAGISDKVVREGIRGLEVLSGFKCENYISKRGKRAKKYFIKIASNNKKGSAFPFYKFILEAGIWREIKPSAKALYPVMRYFGFFDIAVYSEFENVEDDFDEVYTSREYDFCDAERSIICEYAGLHRNSLNSVLKDLESSFLIEPLDEYYRWKVFLRSKDHKIWKRDYLNKKVMASYKHIF